MSVHWGGRGPGHLSRNGKAARFNPLALFANGEQGGWYDFNDAATIWADTAGTTPATTGGAVARVDDKSGNGNHIIQATAANRPIWTQSGTASYLTFDGTNDHLHTSASVDWTVTDEVSVYAVLTKTSDAAAAVWLNSRGVTSFSATAPNTAAGTQITFRSTGGTLRTSIANHAAPTTKVFAGRAKITTDLCEVWINGALGGSVATDQGAGTAYSNQVMAIGANDTTPTLPFNGRLTGELIIRGALPANDAEHVQVQTYLNSLTGVY